VLGVADLESEIVPFFLFVNYFLLHSGFLLTIPTELVGMHRSK